MNYELPSCPLAVLLATKWRHKHDDSDPDWILTPKCLHSAPYRCTASQQTNKSYRFFFSFFFILLTCKTLKYAQKYCREPVFTVMCTFCKTLPLDTATALKPSVLTHSKQHDSKTLGLPVREKKREEFLHFSWDLLERLHDMDLHRLGPYFQLSRAPCDPLACQIDLIHANVSLQYIQQYCITMQ